MKGYKTIAFNIIGIIIMITEHYGVGLGLPLPIVGYIVTVGNFILRVFFTDTPVGSSIKR